MINDTIKMKRNEMDEWRRIRLSLLGNATGKSIGRVDAIQQEMPAFINAIDGLEAVNLK